MVASSFEGFLHSRSADLRKLAARTRGEYSGDELASESWLISTEIAIKRGWPFDFADDEDQDTLFAWMHNRFVKYADKAIRFAIRLDRGWDDEASEQAGAALARLLTAPLDCDPQVRQQLLDDQQGFVEMLQHSYSEATAYVLLLVRVDWHLEDLAKLLWISTETLRQRMRRSGLLARIQPSLFDGISVIDATFQPWSRFRSLARKAAKHDEAGFCN